MYASRIVFALLCLRRDFYSVLILFIRHPLAAFAAGSAPTYFSAPLSACPVTCGFCESTMTVRRKGPFSGGQDMDDWEFTKRKDDVTAYAPYLNLTDALNEGDRGWGYTPDIWSPPNKNSLPPACDSASAELGGTKPCICDIKSRMYCDYMGLNNDNYFERGINFTRPVFDAFLEYNEIEILTKKMITLTFNSQIMVFSMAGCPLRRIEQGAMAKLTMLNAFPLAFMVNPGGGIILSAGMHEGLTNLMMIGFYQSAIDGGIMKKEWHWTGPNGTGAIGGTMPKLRISLRKG